ncbi:MAG TPA: hypothetical protein VMP10_00935 [Chloroflexota bacterium]|nr:hypothetical protein [Chloroflexota bacterium]
MTAPGKPGVDRPGPDDDIRERENARFRLPSTLPIIAVPLVIVLGYLFWTTFEIRTGTDAIGVILQALLVVVLAGLIAIVFDRSW